jgi:AcrR family transcriptional regulator
MGKRTDILLTTEKILAERGLYGLSMKLLADTAGIAAGTIYRYFTNKETLMIELYQYVRQEVAINIFTGWSEQQTNSEKYYLLWINIFHAVLSNPQRLAVIEMLYYLPNECRNKLDIFDDKAFQPMVHLYQQGIDNKELKNWPIPVLMALSLDSSVSLAKKVLRDNIEINEHLIQQACEASWTTITN